MMAKCYTKIQNSATTMHHFQEHTTILQLVQSSAIYMNTYTNQLVLLLNMLQMYTPLYVD